MFRIASCGASGGPAIGTNMVTHKQIPRLGSCCASRAWMAKGSLATRILVHLYLGFTCDS